MRLLEFVCSIGLILLASAAFASSEVPFDVTLRADTVPGVGREGTFTVAVQAKRNLPGLTIEVQFPDDARLIGDRRFTATAASEAAPIRCETKAVFTTPGLKSIRAVAKCAEKPGIVWSAVAYLTLEVTEASGQVVTDTFNTRIPPKQLSKGTGKMLGRPDADKSPGQAIPEANVPPKKVKTNSDSIAVRQASSSDDLVISGKWSFVNRGGSIVGMRYHTVTLIKTLPTEMVIETAQTDSEGNFVFDPVEYTSVGLYVRCSTTYDGPGNDVSVIVLPGQFFSSDTNIFSYATGGSHSVGEWIVSTANPQYKAWWVCDDMIRACFTAPDPIGAHTAWFDPVNNGGAYYSPGGRVHLFANDVDDTPDTVLHEMGHSVMYNIYGDYMPDNPNCMPHSLMGDSSTGCAWTEGWAHIWHMWTTNDPVRHYPGGGNVDLEAPTWGDGNDEGSDVEGRVAGALWDIADSNNDGCDTYSGGWSDIWHIMYHHNCDKFSEFYDQWKAHGYNTHGAVACIYQNTIDWNESPLLSALPDVTVPEDEFRANAIDLDDYASDFESQDYQLQFTIANVSDPNLQIGIDYDHEINLQGMPNWSGWADVQVNCTDGIDTASTAFRVTVTPVNDAPVVMGLPDKTLDEDGSLSNTVDVQHFATDAENASSQLAYSITGNTDPSCGVSLTSNRYISISPIADWFGTSDITVRATDPQGLWDEDTFRITVNSINDPPVIAGLPDRTLNEDSSLTNTIDLWAYATDVEIPSSALTYTIESSGLPAGAVTISSNRYVSITPPANYNGSGSVTVRAWDWEGGYGDDAFVVTVSPIADPPVIAIDDQTYQTAKVSTYQDIDLHRFASDPDGPVSELTFTVHRNTNPTTIGASIYSDRYLRIAHGAFVSGYTELTIRVTDPTGLWSDDKLNVVVGRLCNPCSDAFGAADGAYVIFPARPVTWSHYYAFYIGDDNRTSGIRINYVQGPEVNRIATVGGLLTSYEGERAVDCLSLKVGGTDPTPPEPFFMTHKSMGGIWPGTFTPAVPTGRLAGLYNVGTLVRTTGTVVSRNSNSFWIADGSGVWYSFSNKGLYVDCQPITMCSPTRGSRVMVTGISGATRLLDDSVVNALRLRSRNEVVGMGGRVAYIYNTASSTAGAYAAMLADAKWQTTTVHLSLLTATDLSAYDAVIIGADTGTWTDTAKVNCIINSDKPVIAMGEGGGKFLDQVPDLYVGWLNSALLTQNQGYVADLSSDLFWWERIISVPTDRLLSTLTGAASTLSLQNPPAGVYGLLRHPTNPQYWAVSCQGQYMQWGYDTQPSNMTQAGKDTLVNAIYYMLAK